jgi:hypothetical protein
MTPIRGLIDTLIVIAASISTTATGFLFEAVAPLPRFGALARSIAPTTSVWAKSSAS